MIGAGRVEATAAADFAEYVGNPTLRVVFVEAEGTSNVTRFAAFSRYVKGVAGPEATDLGRSAHRLSGVLLKVMAAADRGVAHQVLAPHLDVVRGLAWGLNGVGTVPSVWRGSLTGQLDGIWGALYRSRRQFSLGARAFLEGQAATLPLVHRVFLNVAGGAARHPGATITIVGALTLAGIWACAASFADLG